MNQQITQPAASEFRGYQQFHVWARVWPSYNRTYRGWVWAADVMDAGTEARKQFGNRQGHVYDIHSEKNGRALRKGA